MKKTLYFIFLRIKNYFLVNECSFFVFFFIFCFKEQKNILYMDKEVNL